MVAAYGNTGKRKKKEEVRQTLLEDTTSHLSPEYCSELNHRKEEWDRKNKERMCTVYKKEFRSQTFEF